MYIGELTDRLCEIQNIYYDKFQANVGLADVSSFLTEDEIIARIQKAIDENKPIPWEDKDFYVDYELIEKYWNDRENKKVNKLYELLVLYLFNNMTTKDFCDNITDIIHFKSDYELSELDEKIFEELFEYAPLYRDSEEELKGSSFFKNEDEINSIALKTYNLLTQNKLI